MMSVGTALIYNFNFTHHFVFWFLLALLAALVSTGELTIESKQSSLGRTALSVLLVIISVMAFSVLWLAGQRLLADARYSSSVMSNRSNQPVQEAIDALNGAVALNRLNDAYYRNLSQAYLIQLGQELQNQPTEEKSSLINSLVTAAIDTAKKAADISPVNVDNWSNVAAVYQSIASFTRGADEFAIKNYQEALLREPNNPVFFNEIGKIYVLRADAYRTLITSSEAKAKKEAEEHEQ
jgi:tetratricopeptide (TPR) repeat protein